MKRQSLHERKIADKSLILTADGNIEINLGDGKSVDINGDLKVTGQASGPQTTNVFYVTKDGNDLNTGRSADANGAFASIKKAAEVAPSGSLIIVAPGDYIENNPITLRDFVTVSGQGELRNTRIFPKNNTDDLFFMGNGCYLFQLTFRGLRYPGWCAQIRPGALVTTSPYVQNCTNMNGPWLNDGTEFIPFETVQIEGIEPGARPLTVLDNPDLPVEKQINPTGGGGGLLVDGDQYDPASLVFSFVADAFTQISQGGIGFHVTNFGYTQIVSCFSVFCSTGFLTTKGGYLSISNSVSDFGTEGVVADGFYPIPYTNAVPLADYYSSVASVTIQNPGAGYTGVPVVTFDPPTGAGGVSATGTAQIDLTTGQVAAISMDSSGSGYETIPNITITGGGASIPAEADANLQTNSTISLGSLRDKPQTGSIIQFEGDSTYYYITETEITKAPFVYDETVCRRDIRRIVDAVTGDIVLGTDYQSQAAGQSYLRSTSTKVILDQLAPTIYGIESARDEMKAVTSNLAMKEEIDARFNIITTVLAAGDSSVLPGAGSELNDSLNDLSSIDEGVIAAKNNVIANRDFIIEELSAYINDQFTELSYDQTQFTTDMDNLLYSMALYIVFGSDQGVLRQAQEIEFRDRFKDLYLTSLEYLRDRVLALTEVAADATSQTRVNEAINQFINIIDDGDSSGITIEFPNHTGAIQNRIDTKDQLLANREFIKAEFTAFIDDDNSSFTYGGQDAATYQTYMGHIVDALIFDMLYTGTSATVQEATYFFNNINYSAFIQSEITTLTDAFARMRFILQRIIRDLPVTPTTGNGETQDFASGAATQVESTIIDGTLQIIENVIIAGNLTGLPTKTYPSFETEPTGQEASANVLLSQRSNFITDAIAQNLANYPTLTYNVEKCKRDVGYIIDAIYRDAQLGTNHNSITAGLAYKRANVAYLDGEQKPATIIALREAKRLLVEAANRDSNFQLTVSYLFDDILNIIEFDQLPSEGTVYPDPGPASTDLINATNQIIANKAFLQEEVIAYINDNNFVYNQAKCERDTGLIIDAAIFDAALGTNYNAVTSGLSYQRANSAYVISGQQTETVGAINYAKGQASTAVSSDATAQTRVEAAFDEIVDIIQNGVVSTDTAADALVFPNPSTATAAQIAAKDQLQANRNFLAKEAVSFVENNYQNFTFNQAKCERDVGLIMDAVALDVALGTNYNAVTAGLSYQRASSADLQDNQKIQTLASIRELKKQLTLLGLSDSAQPRMEAAIDEVIDILDNGVLSTNTAADALVFPTPGVLPTADAAAAKNQLIANKEFVKDEILAWIAVNFPSLTYDAVKCERDVSYIVDAVCHDILYGGNSATITAARSYFVDGVGQLGNASEEAATADAYNRLGDILGDIVIEAPVSKSTGNLLSQDTSGIAAGSTEADDVEGLVKIIEDVIRAGNLDGLPATVLPNITWAADDLEQAYSVIKGNKETVQTEIIIFIANNFQTFSYDEAKCRRDVGILVEAAAYDAAFGTNYNAVTSGLAYQRANSGYVLSDQNLQTVESIKYLRDQLSTASGISSQFSARIITALNEVVDIIENGVVSTDTAADALVFPVPSVLPTTAADNANTQLQTNKGFLGKEVVAYVNTTYPSLTYDQVKCERDTKYIVDALSYDVLYGGNLATKAAAEAYFVGTASQLGAGQQAATIDAYTQLKTWIAEVVQNNLIAAPQQGVVTQDTTGAAAGAIEAGVVQNLLQIIIDVITAGNIDGLPADIAPSITWTSASDQGSFTHITERKSSYQNAVITFINDTFTRNFTFNSTKCERDTKYIVDALTYDVLYGGNSATRAAADSYFVGTSNQVTGQQQETADALGWVNTLLGSVLLDTAYNDPEQTVVTQTTGGGAASATEVTLVGTLLDVIQDVINNGTDNLPVETNPDITWAAAGIQTAVGALTAAKSTIITDTIAFIGTTYNGFNYDQAVCRRDTGYLIDAVAHDLLYTGNIATLIATRAYFLGAVQYIPTYQVANTVAAYNHLADIAQKCIEGIGVSPTTGNTETQVLSGNYGTSVESATSTSLINIVKDAIANETLVGTPGEVEPNFSWLPEATRTAAFVMLSEKANIQDSVITYITTNLVNFTYNIDKCKRDTGYLIDAAIYDTMYQGNKQTRRAADAYYAGAILGAAKVGNADQTLVTAYSYYKLADIMSQVVLNDPVTKSFGNVLTQDVSIPDGSLEAANNFALLIDRIALSLIEGYTTGWQEQNHNYELGSAVYNTERLAILGNLQTIEDNAVADLNQVYGGTANVRLFPGLVTVNTGQQGNLYNVSTISTSGHAFEYVGAGVTYNALPFFGGSAIPEQEIIERNQGKVFAGGTVDQIGNFRVGNFFGVNALTGAITLNANEIDLQGLTSVGPFIREGIPVGVELKEVSDNSNLISSIGTQDFNTAPTQRAVSVYVENRYLNKLNGGTVNNDVTFDTNVTVDGELVLTNNDLAVVYGGTGRSSFVPDGVVYGDGTAALKVTEAAGSADASFSYQLLTVTGDGDSNPVWTDTLDGGEF